MTPAPQHQTLEYRQGWAAGCAYTENEVEALAMEVRDLRAALEVHKAEIRRLHSELEARRS